MAAVSLVIDTAVEKSTLVMGENELLINLNFTLLFGFRATPSINIPSNPAGSIAMFCCLGTELEKQSQ